MLQDRFTTHTLAEINSARIALARSGCDRAEQTLAQLRAELDRTPDDAPGHAELINALKIAERAIFNRQLELAMLLRTRRQRGA